MDYKKNKRYFSKESSKKFPVILIIVGIILCFNKTILHRIPLLNSLFQSEIPLLNNPILLGILLLATGIITIFLLRRPSDAIIDAAVKEECEELQANALKKLGLDEDEIAIATPIQTWGYARSERLSKHDVSIADALSPIEGKDERQRTPVVEMHFFGFSENEINHYGRYKSLLSDTVVETTDVINYQDVVSIKTRSDLYPYQNPKTGLEDKKRKAKCDSFEVIVPGDVICCNVYDFNTADESVNALRALVKQKKNV